MRRSLRSCCAARRLAPEISDAALPTPGKADGAGWPICGIAGTARRAGQLFSRPAEPRRRRKDARIRVPILGPTTKRAVEQELR